MALEILLTMLLMMLSSALLLAVMRSRIVRSRMALSNGWRALKYTRFCKALRLTASRTHHDMDGPASDPPKSG